MIGNLGEIVFKVSNDNIRTFTNLKESNSAKFVEHSVIGKKGLLEFVGFGAATVTMKIKLDYTYGLNPYEELKTFRKMFKAREAYDLVIGGKPIGDSLWVIENFDEELETFDSAGNFISATIDIRLREYIDDYDGS